MKKMESSSKSGNCEDIVNSAIHIMMCKAVSTEAKQSYFGLCGEERF